MAWEGVDDWLFWDVKGIKDKDMGTIFTVVNIFIKVLIFWVGKDEGLKVKSSTSLHVTSKISIYLVLSNFTMYNVIKKIVKYKYKPTETRAFIRQPLHHCQQKACLED